VEASAGSTRNERILDEVLLLLEQTGYDGWHVRQVAEGARVSLSTIYRDYPSRDDLIVAAVTRWMERSVYRPIEPRLPDEDYFSAIRRVLRAVFETWERYPAMLQIVLRVLATPSGDQLHTQGLGATQWLSTSSGFPQIDPAYLADVVEILHNLVEGLETRFLRGEILVKDILPSLDRAISRLQDPPVSPASGTRRRKRAPRGQQASR
jgi:AcrR family transcriptional regulator